MNLHCVSLLNIINFKPLCYLNAVSPLLHKILHQHVTLLQAFSGTQNVSSLQKEEAWRVNVRIQGLDLDHGYLCGTMEALNVPMADTPVSGFYFHQTSIRFSVYSFYPTFVFSCIFIDQC